LSLKDNIDVLPFDIDSGEIEAMVSYGNFHYKHQARFEEFENYTMTYLI